MYSTSRDAHAYNRDSLNCLNILKHAIKAQMIYILSTTAATNTDLYTTRYITLFAMKFYHNDCFIVVLVVSLHV